MSNRSLFERVMNMEKKTNRFNLKLHMQATFNGTFTDGSLEQAAFKMNQLRLEARGDINDWLSYRWRQRLNSSNTPHALDNLPSSIDYAMISVRLTDKFTTSIGKQAAAYGGFEYDLDPIEIYQYSDMIDYMLFDFMTGITFSYQVNPTQEIALQVVNSRTASMKDIYGQLPAGIEESKAPLAYSVNWNGNFFNNTFRTRWSYSLLCQAKKYNNHFYQILNQIVSLPERDKLTNLVFMGMGEPLDNTGEVLRALEILTAEWGFGWSPTRITLSTAGVVPELRRFLDATKVHLAVSLHNPFHEERMEIMPVERAWPIAEVAAILREYDFTHQRRVSFEYIVMSGLNDSPRHIRELTRLVNGIKCRINLIRFHRIPDSPYFSPGDEAMIRFRDALTARGIQTTIRASRGEDIQAACGLLSTRLKAGL